MAAPMLCGRWRLIGIPVLAISYLLFLTFRLGFFYLGLIVRTLVPLLISPFLILYLYVDMIVMGLHAIYKTSCGGKQ